MLVLVIMIEISFAANVDHRKHRTSNIEHRTPNTEYRTPNTEL